MMDNNDILSVLNGQTSVLTYAFNPETIAFRNKVIELQKNCSMIEWEHDMGKTIPYCKLDNSFCNGQCSYKANDCSCDKEGKVEMNATEKVIIDLKVAKLILCNPEMLSPEMCVRIGQAITSAINLLTEKEGYVSVPFSWLVKFCTHINFNEPMWDEDREKLWKQTLKQQFDIDIPSKE